MALINLCDKKDWCLKLDFSVHYDDFAYFYL
jgi:hypothetical protein